MAAAGSGKTVLLRSWLEDAGLTARLAWVTVERAEHDAQRFWLALIHALAAAAPELELEQPVPTPGFDGGATADRLAAALSGLHQPVVLVIDDLQELVSRDAQMQLEILVARRTPMLRIVVAARHDPQLGLHRLRLGGELLEVRAADLRFTPAETRQLLASSGIELSDAAVDQLTSRTEGWAAGLRLALLSLAGQPDREGFVAQFSGNDRTVAEYLLAEVLERQPDDVREFLLRTSIVDGLDPSLADALASTSASSAVLAGLERDGAFVERSERDPESFRYHQLLADMLRLELRRRHPAAVPELHGVAALWYEDHGLIVEAVRHAQAAGDWPTAIRLLASNVLSLILDGQTSTLGALLNGFPLALRSSAELALVHAGIAIVEGSLDDATAYLAIADAGRADVPDDRRHAYEIEAIIARLSLARRRGDLARVNTEIEALLALGGPTTSMGVELNNDARAVSLLELGIAELWTSDLDGARSHLDEGLQVARRIPRPFVEIGCLGYLAVIAGSHSVQRQQDIARQALAVAEAHGWGTQPITTMSLAMLAIAAIAQGRFDEGRTWHARTVQALNPQSEPASAILVKMAEAMLHVGAGALTSAVDVLAEAEAMERALVTPTVIVRMARELQASLLLRLGRTDDAGRVVGAFSEGERDRAEALAAAGELELFRSRPRNALDTLAPLLRDGSATIADTTLVHAWIVAAQAHDALGDARAASAAIESALETAEGQTLIFPFVVSAARDILGRVPRHETRHAAFLADILDILSGASSGPRARPAEQPFEELSQSELRVLRFLPSNLSAPEIASELFLSTSTIKTHMRHIYDKLGAHKRTEAVQRARELGLLASAARRTE